MPIRDPESALVQSSLYISRPDGRARAVDRGGCGDLPLPQAAAPPHMHGEQRTSQKKFHQKPKIFRSTPRAAIVRNMLSRRGSCPQRT